MFEGFSDDNPSAFSAAAAKLFPPNLGSKGYDLLFGVVTGEALFRFPERDLQNGFEPDRRDRLVHRRQNYSHRFLFTGSFSSWNAGPRAFCPTFAPFLLCGGRRFPHRVDKTTHF